MVQARKNPVPESSRLARVRWGGVMPRTAPSRYAPMNDLQFFVACVALSACAWAFLCRTYIWPRLANLSLPEAATPILVLHLFRFVGAAFMIQGVVSPTLSAGFAVPAAYGDFVAVLLAWLALLLRGKPLFLPAVWGFNIWGTLDLLFAFFIPTVYNNRPAGRGEA